MHQPGEAEYRQRVVQQLSGHRTSAAPVRQAAVPVARSSGDLLRVDASSGPRFRVEQSDGQVGEEVDDEHDQDGDEHGAHHHRHVADRSPPRRPAGPCRAGRTPASMNTAPPSRPNMVRLSTIRPGPAALRSTCRKISCPLGDAAGPQRADVVLCRACRAPPSGTGRPRRRRRRSAGPMTGRRDRREPPEQALSLGGYVPGGREHAPCDGEGEDEARWRR